MSSTRYVEVSAFGRAARIPIIGSELLGELMKVEPSGESSPGEYRPCQVELYDGRVLDRVYVAEAMSYIFSWGVWPENDPGKEALSILDVKHIQSSPSRLPANLANKLYEGGETSMGGVSFYLVLRDGRIMPALTGNAVDFLEYPPGVDANDVADVIHGRTGIATPSTVRGASYRWCLYCLEPGSSKASPS